MRNRFILLSQRERKKEKMLVFFFTDIHCLLWQNKYKRKRNNDERERETRKKNKLRKCLQIIRHCVYVSLFLCMRTRVSLCVYVHNRNSVVYTFSSLFFVVVILNKVKCMFFIFHLIHHRLMFVKFKMEENRRHKKKSMEKQTNVNNNINRTYFFLSLK